MSLPTGSAWLALIIAALPLSPVLDSLSSLGASVDFHLPVLPSITSSVLVLLLSIFAIPLLGLQLIDCGGI